MLQSARGGGGVDWQTPTLQNLKRGSQFRLLGTRTVVQKRVSLHIPTSLARPETNTTERPRATAGFFQVPPDLTFFFLSHRPRPPARSPPPARAPQIRCRLSRPPPDGCQSQLSAVPWLPKQRSLGALATPLRNCFPPSVVFAQSLASECSLVPASPPRPS